MRIRTRILVRLGRHKNRILTLKNILYAGKYVIHTVTAYGRYKSNFERLEIRFIFIFWSISLILDPNADPDPD